MSYEKKDNRGVLFKNKEKAEMKPSEKAQCTQADYNGSIRVEGKDYWLNAWLKKDRNGNWYMSLSAQEFKEQRTESKEQTERMPLPDDDIPF